MAYRQEIEATAKIAQLDRADELIREQLHLIEQRLRGLEQMRTSLLNRLERHAQVRNELLNRE